MSIKHHATGAPCPPLVDGKIRIFSMRFCPYAQRAVLVAAAKDIPHDIVYCNLKQKPEFLLERNPSGKVPTLETPKGVIYESLIVSDYLDEAYPGRPLNPTDSFAKALDRVWVERFSGAVTLFYKIIMSSAKGEELEKIFKEFEVQVGNVQSELSRRGTKFFGGNEAPGMLDYMIWPWMERMSLIRLTHPDRDFKDVKSNSTILIEWIKAMKEDKAVKQSYLSPETHMEFVKSMVAGSPNYDLSPK